VKHRTRLDRENTETLYAYAQFLGESTEYVLNQVIDTVLARDKDFIAWRAEHPDSCVPRSQDRRPVGRRNQHKSGSRAVSAGEQAPLTANA